MNAESVDSRACLYSWVGQLGLMQGSHVPLGCQKFNHAGLNPKGVPSAIGKHLLLRTIDTFYATVIVRQMKQNPSIGLQVRTDIQNLPLTAATLDSHSFVEQP